MRELLFVLGFILIVFAASAVYAPTTAEVQQQVLDIAQEENSVPIIITLKEEKHSPIPSEVATEEIVGAVIASGGSVKQYQSLETTFAATVSEEQLLAIASNPSVERISYDRPVRAFLSQSVPLIRADLVHNLQSSGVNQTGKGVTVCIIDTGVDYTRPELGGGIGTGYKVLGGYNFVSNTTEPLDDNGHGTHVAGIVAAKGALTGVAPDTNIVAIKALDGAGNGDTSDIIAGINWCVTNRGEYNISVISMSLGSIATYSSYCDTDDPEMAIAVNNAVQNGILVVAATGNDANYTAISSPACIRNTTRVVATYDSNVGSKSYSDCSDPSTAADTYTCFSNRGQNFADILLAPGAAITSVVPSNAMCGSNPSGLCSDTNRLTLSGTSMATPHVSGVAALVIQRYKEKHGSAPTVDTIYQYLNESGVYLSDPNTTNTYSRVDAYASISSVGLPPEVTEYYNNISGINNSSVSLNETQSAFFNASFDQAMTSFVWKRNDSIIAGESNQNYTWTTNYTDAGTWSLLLEASNANGSVMVNWNVIVGNVNAPPQFNATLSNQTFELEDLPQTIFLGSNITDIDDLSQITITTNDSNVIANSSAKTLTFNYSDRINATVLVTLTDSENATANQSIFVTVQDTQAPTITVSSPSNNSKHNNATINLTASVSNVSGSTILFNYTFNGSNYSLSSGQTVWLAAFEGENTVVVTAEDNHNNSNSVTRTFSVDTTRPQIQFENPTPANGSSTNSTSASITVNVSITETNLDTITLYLNGAINQTKNSSSLVGNTVSFSLIGLTNGQYPYYVVVNDTVNNANQTETRTYIVDTTNPVIALTAPANNSYVNSQMISILGTVTDLTNVSLAINDTARFSVNSGTNTNFNYANSSLIEGTYSISLTATDLYGKTGTNTTTFTIDRTIPPSNISDLAANSITTNSVNLTWTEISVADVFTYKIYAFEGSSEPTSLEGPEKTGTIDADNNGTTYKKMSSLSANQTYWFVVTTLDRAGNENTTIHSANKIKVTTAAATSSNNEGTTSQPTSTPVAATTQTVQEKPIENPKQIFSVAKIPVDYPYPFSVSKQGIDVMQIVIEAAQEIADVQLTVEKLQGRPGSTTEPSGAVYSYLQIDAPALEEQKLKRATIRFRVEPAWLSSEGLSPEDVVLLRFKDGAWNELETNLVDSNDNYYYYDAYTPGFSYFAISSSAKESSDKTISSSEKGINEAEYESAQPRSGIPGSTLILMLISIGVVGFGIMWLRNDLNQGRRVLYTRPTAFINVPF